MKPVFAAWDLNRLHILPPNWQQDINYVTKSFGMATVLEGKSSTSREAEKTDPMVVSVVMGEVIHQNLPWLTALYKQELRCMAEYYFGAPLQISHNLQSAININRLDGDGARYERHVDSNPCTGLLFVNTLEESNGGALVFDIGAEQIRLQPTSGVFLAFDAQGIVHWVNSLCGSVSRISIPMNYYIAGADQVRPTDLDGYLYRSSGTNNDVT